MSGRPFRRAWFGAGVGWLLALLQACSESQPVGPSTGPFVVLEYTQPRVELASPPPFDLTMCLHHFAPANLTVSTSWGFRGRLSPTGGDTRAFATLLTDVPVGATLWVAVLDIEWCNQGSPQVLSGLRANDVQLTRIVEPEEGLKAFQFSVTRGGRVLQ